MSPLNPLPSNRNLGKYTKEYSTVSNPNVTSASHCQGGDAASVSTFILAFPIDKVYKSFKVLPAYSQTQLGGKKRSKSKKQTKKRAPKKRT